MRDRTVDDASRDPALLAGFRRGEAAALRDIYHRYGDRLFRFLVRLCGRVDVAEDLHQETWIAATRAAGRLAPDSDLCAWLFTIARNKYRSYRRWQGSQSARFQSAADPSAGAAAGSHDLDARHDLENALAALPLIHREVLLLIGCEGLDHAQAAAVLGISVEAARQRLSRARAALTDQLGREGPGNVIDLQKGVARS